MKRGRTRGEWRVALGTAFGMVLLAFCLPLLCFGGNAGAEETTDADPADVLAPLSSAEPVDATVHTGELDGAYTVRVLCEDGTVRSMSMGDYLWGVVAAEMPASFEVEALKAQAVAARTYTLWKMQHTATHAAADVCMDYACCQAWISHEDAAERWGENAVFYTERLASAISATDGIALCWDGQPIQAVFHSSSAGKTEDAVAVWGSTVPYLQSVDSPEGDEVPNYHSSVTWTADELRAALTELGCELSGAPETWLGSTVCTESGMVQTIEAGGVELSGAALRAALGLRSSVFTVSYRAGSFTFSVTGYGHGVGMSQYGANALAQEGKSWQEIVEHYYTGVTVETYLT